MEPLHHPVDGRIGADLADKEHVVPLRHRLGLQHRGELEQDPGRVANIEAPGLLENPSADLLVLRLAGDAPVGVALLGDDGDGAGTGGPVRGGRGVDRAWKYFVRVSLVGYNVMFTLLYNPSHTNLLYMSGNSQRMKSSNIKHSIIDHDFQSFNRYYIFDCNADVYHSLLMVSSAQEKYKKQNKTISDLRQSSYDPATR